eukprot:TRINITY_DN65100_c0_g1_i1.p1 TRINITY_DN65100_c0_g1~~TRINITY_DN65100_c0_g1_i1.p1  ORF type:complete len:315 (-),score=44.04 TRINITY_DN65100_c0_g1_i1:672-1616(-)
MNCSGARDVAVAAAVGLSWERLRTFVMSFRHFASRCAMLVLLVGESPPEDLLDKLRVHDVQALRLSAQWPFVQPESFEEAVGARIPVDELRRLIPEGLSSKPGDKRGTGGLILLRHFIADVWYTAMAEASPEATGLAMVIDAVDVVFQGDPFGKISDGARNTDRVWFFEEHPSRLVKECSFTREAIEPFPIEQQDIIAEQTVVNGGVVLGATTAMRRLNAAMRQVLEATHGQHMFTDQGLLNVIARINDTRYEHGPSEVILHGQGPVRNLGIELWEWGGYANSAAVQVRAGEGGWICERAPEGQPYKMSCTWTT